MFKVVYFESDYSCFTTRIVYKSFSINDCQDFIRDNQKNFEQNLWIQDRSGNVVLENLNAFADN